MPKYYPIIKQVYILWKFCTVNHLPNSRESCYQFDRTIVTSA